MSETRRGPEREPQLFSRLERYLPENAATENAVKFDRECSRLGDDIEKLIAMLDMLAENPSEVPNYELYRGHLDDRLGVLADEWERLNAAKDHLEEAIRLSGEQEMGEA